MRCSIGRHGGNVSSSTWHGQPRDDYPFSILPPVSPGRRQQKWMVDAAWLENVRKVLLKLRKQFKQPAVGSCSAETFGAVPSIEVLLSLFSCHGSLRIDFSFV